MRDLPRILINTPDIELWPGGLLRARNNHDTRILARARHVLRRKRDGRFLAADLAEGLVPLVYSLRTEPGIDVATRTLATASAHRRSDVVATLPLDRLHERLHALGLDDGYGERSGLPLVAEPTRAWTHLRDAALRDDVVLEAISGYRSHDYQLGIFERKLARGLTVDEILTVNAAPGYSEHHSGLALDIGVPDEPPAEESFERTAAFAWLRENAGDYGFVMSYPRDNPHGIVYEPWHWAFSPH